MGAQPGEVVLVLVNAEEEEQARAALTKRVPRAGVVLGVAMEGGLGAAVYLQRRCLRVPFADTPAGWKRLFAACAEVAGDAVVALGRRYPAIRAAAAQRVVLRTAGQNALVGLAFLLPGADMPAMTLNQMKMLLLLAAMHEQEVNAERAVELAMVLGLGYGFRGLARRLVRSRRGYGWL
ncbi:MAG: hypothetical protein H5T84_07950, partial [Thermoleophilia bacterium]|nr:hypothetical protein [Thermoleophilia bacterium]